MSTTMTCARCKNEVTFHDWQWSNKCDNCGNLIILTKRSGTQQGNKYNCSYCRDTGWIVIEKQINGQVYEYGYRCVCEAGRDRPEIGIPFAVDVDMSLVK